MTLVETAVAAFAGVVVSAWVLYWLAYKPVKDRYHAKEAGE